MERIKELNTYQKIMLLAVVLLMVVFTVIYPVVSARVGFEYQGKILVPREENGNTVYESGNTVITVTADKSVTVEAGGKVYGPYSGMVDPSAVPADNTLAEYMTGVELRCGEDVFFRGGVYSIGGDLHLVNADGSGYFVFTVTMSDGTLLDHGGNPVDPDVPAAGTILDLMKGPELTRKGIWAAWAAGVFVCVLTMVSILFVDELYYWSMSFKVADPYATEPSDWVIASRYIEWTALPVMALVVFILGLL